MEPHWLSQSGCIRWKRLLKKNIPTASFLPRTRSFTFNSAPSQATSPPMPAPPPGLRMKSSCLNRLSQANLAKFIKVANLAPPAADPKSKTIFPIDCSVPCGIYSGDDRNAFDLAARDPAKRGRLRDRPSLCLPTNRSPIELRILARQIKTDS